MKKIELVQHDHSGKLEKVVKVRQDVVSLTTASIADGALDDAHVLLTGLEQGDQVLVSPYENVAVGVIIQGIAGRRGTAQAGAASTITLDAAASADNDAYNGGVIRIVGGTGEGQSKTISDYVGSTKVATVDSAWATEPDDTSVFAIDGVLQLVVINESGGAFNPTGEKLNVTLVKFN